MKRDDAMSVSWHEAGHAIADYVHFGCVARLRRWGETDGHAAISRPNIFGPLGVSRLAASSDPAHRHMAIAIAHAGVRACLAGRVAEGLIPGRRGALLCDDDDYHCALEFLDAAHPEWPAMVETAGELVPGEERWQAIDREWRRTRRLLVKYREHVRTVAELLMRSPRVGKSWLRSVRSLHPQLTPPRYRSEARLPVIADGWVYPGAYGEPLLRWYDQNYRD